MDDLTFSARRASAAAPPRTEPADLETRFRSLVQSPLRAGILRYLSARPEESFDVESLMQTFGRLRTDVENCVRELADFGVAFAIGGTPVRYIAARPTNDPLIELLDTFLERRATVSTEDKSPSVQRFREMIGRDEKMLIVFEWIRTAAKSDISVLILGPTGSGKEVVARMIHELSPRSVANFQAVNCAALPDTLFESEIFGYEKGPSRARTTASRAASSSPTRARSFSTRSPTRRSSRRPSCCVCSRNTGSSGWAGTRPSRSISD